MHKINIWLEDRNRSIRISTGALTAALVISTCFTLFGYSEGATLTDYLKQVFIALTSYVSAALLIYYWATQQDSILYDIVSVSLLGSAVRSFMKLIFVDAQNGIPAYIANAERDHSWSPYGDLVIGLISNTIFVTLLALPFVAIGVLLGMAGFKYINNKSN